MLNWIVSWVRGPTIMGDQCCYEVETELKDLAVAMFLEGCVGETLAALTAAEQRDRATDEVTRSALATIAAVLGRACAT
ncbi:MAG TPA: hypothetical protein ENK57_20580 [Polyangiaceae bacterium]|nr:hypothetical protein [Polyangiaceae bacterium]